MRTDTTHINTQYQTILHTFGPWHLQRFSCPDRRSLDKEKAACVACDKVNKCKISSKKWKTAKTILHFPGKAWFFLRVFYLTEWLKILCEFFRIFWQPASQSASYTFIKGWHSYRACSACSISSLIFFVLAAHVEAFWAMCWPFSWTWAFQCCWVLVHARRFWCSVGACCT